MENQTQKGNDANQKPDGTTGEKTSETTNTSNLTPEEMEELVEFRNIKKETGFKKFQDSATEAIRLNSEAKLFEGERKQYTDKITELEEEIGSVRDVAKDDNPEGYNYSQLAKNTKENQKEIALIKESNKLNDFISSKPEAKTFRDTLKNFGRAMPDKNFSEIWENNFKSVVDVSEDKKVLKKSQTPETGSGTSTADFSDDKLGGHSPEEFAKLPMEKRKAFFKTKKLEKL